MRYSLAVASAPEVEPVSLDEAKLHLRVDVADDDSLISAQIIAARRWCENYTRRTFVSTGYELRMDGFPAIIRVPRPPLQLVTGESASPVITYVDSAGAEQTLDSALFAVDAHSAPGRIFPAYGCSWPSARGFADDVLVEFIAGYGDAGADVPEDLRAAVKLLLGHMYEHRESVVIGAAPAVVPQAVEALLAPYRVHDEF